MMIFDAHAHLPLREGAVSRLLLTLDANEISRAIVVAGGSLTPERLARQINEGGGVDVDIDNAAVLRGCEESNGRLIPFHFANPYRDAVDYAREGRAFRGLKLGPAVHGIPLTDERHAALVAVARDFGHPVYLHCLARSGFRVEDLVVLAARFSDVTFILGHAGIGNADYSAAEIIADSPNILFETSGGFSTVIAKAVARLGATRVLFGSEYPLQDPYLEVAKIRRLDLAGDSIAGILGGNIARVLHA